jgi:hypothetical protein
MRAKAMLLAGVVGACFASPSYALVVTFTGGTVTRLDATTQTTNNTVTWDNVDYYEESGFKLDFLPNSGSAGFATHVGNYYSAGNDVIHSHWVTGNFGGVMSNEITRSAGGTFDINGFTLTSNTAQGGGPALGFELAYVEGFNSNVSTGPAVLLPPEDWGFPGTAVNLGSAFDNVDKVMFYVQNPVDCFGMDDFNMVETPEPASLGLCCAMGGAALLRHRRRH